MLSPIELIAGFMPIIGPIADIVVVALALRYAARPVPPEALVEAWPAERSVAGVALTREGGETRIVLKRIERRSGGRPPRVTTPPSATNRESTGHLIRLWILALGDAATSLTAGLDLGRTTNDPTATLGVRSKAARPHRTTSNAPSNGSLRLHRGLTIFVRATTLLASNIEIVQAATMSPAPALIEVAARPDVFGLSPGSTAVIVVDMQHDFAAPQGMFGRAGIPLHGIQAVVEPTRRVLDAARQAGILVVYLTMQYDEDLSKLGSASAPNRLRHMLMGVGEDVAAPDGTRSRVLVSGTWNTKILDELAPHARDLVVAKHRYSGFFETDLDELLRERDISSLIFTGCTTSVCVESTLRDAFYRDYQCLLLTDCCAEAIGSNEPRTNHQATLTVVEALFGWTAESANLLTALSA